MLTSNNLYNFLSNVLTNYNNILQNPFKFVILYQKGQKDQKKKSRMTDNIISNRAVGFKGRHI